MCSVPALYCLIINPGLCSQPAFGLCDSWQEWAVLPIAQHIQHGKKGVSSLPKKLVLLQPPAGDGCPSRMFHSHDAIAYIRCSLCY